MTRIENPEERTFKRKNLLRFVRDRRPEFVAAALAVLRAHEVAGRPKHRRPPMGSYEEWDERIRACVLWLTGHDPLEGRQKIRRGESGEVEQMRVLFSAIFAAFRGRATTTIDLLERATHDDSLLAAIRGVDAAWRGQDVGAQPLGFALRRWAGRIAGGLRLERAGEARAGMLWRVVAQQDAASPPAAGGRGDCGDSGESTPRSSGRQDGGSTDDASTARGDEIGNQEPDPFSERDGMTRRAASPSTLCGPSGGIPAPGPTPSSCDGGTVPLRGTEGENLREIRNLRWEGARGTAGGTVGNAQAGGREASGPGYHDGVEPEELRGGRARRAPTPTPLLDVQPGDPDGRSGGGT